MITGAAGQLGSDLVALLTAHGGGAYQDRDELRAFTRSELDLTDSTAVAAAVSEFRPDVVVNAAAYTAVDAAESDEDAAFLANASAPAILAVALARQGGRLVHVSTDYVFAGDATTPYEVDAPTGPRSAYGRTKLAGELAVRELLPDTSYVVRAAWVYGATGANFVKTMVRLCGERETVSVVDDQRGSPTWSLDLARGLIDIGRSNAKAGTYHCTNAGDTTWFEFTQAIFAELGADPARVLATTTDAFPRPAPRPAFSVLSDHAWIEAGLTPLPTWRSALSAAFAAGAFA
jgi:dTDP-4-dehydrorhamnose reductase